MNVNQLECETNCFARKAGVIVLDNFYKVWITSKEKEKKKSYPLHAMQSLNQTITVSENSEKDRSWKPRFERRGFQGLNEEARNYTKRSQWT